VRHSDFRDTKRPNHARLSLTCRSSREPSESVSEREDAERDPIGAERLWDSVLARLLVDAAMAAVAAVSIWTTQYRPIGQCIQQQPNEPVWWQGLPLLRRRP
jgi:hypothetical protein